MFEGRSLGIGGCGFKVGDGDANVRDTAGRLGLEAFLRMQSGGAGK